MTISRWCGPTLLAALFAVSTLVVIHGEPSPFARLIRPDDANLRFIGHWDKSHLADRAATVNSGSRILCSFTGHTVHGLFNTEGITSPAEIYASIDGGKPLLYRVDRNEISFTPQPLPGTRHHLEIDVKDVDEHPNRWIPPLESALIFKGLVLGRTAKTLPPPALGSVKMEFYGDSITQGILLLSRTVGPVGSDGTKDYAFLTALAFDAVHNQVGFGRQGILREGYGNVPPAPASFGWNYEGSRADPGFIPDIVVVNQGTNDGNSPSETFRPAYRAYIEQIRKAYPQAWIFCLRTFGGFHEADVKSAVESLADARVIYVDTTGWLEPADYTDGVHPNAKGHVKVTQRLVEVVSSHTGLKPAHKAE